MTLSRDEVCPLRRKLPINVVAPCLLASLGLIIFLTHASPGIGSIGLGLNVHSNAAHLTNATRLARVSCPSPMPCHEHVVTRQNKLDVDALPLAKTTHFQTNKTICSVSTSRRVFEESGIDLQELTQLKPCDIFNLIQGKSLWLVGDSQQQSLFMALRGFMLPFSRDGENDQLKPIGIPSVDHILTFYIKERRLRPACIALIKDTRICNVRMPSLIEDGFNKFEYAMEMLSRVYADFSSHLVVFNVGLHYRNSEDRLSTDLQAVARSRRDQLSSGRRYLPKTIWMSTPAQHFRDARGGYDASQVDKVCVPLNDEFLSRGDRGAFNTVSDPFVGNISDAQIDAWDASKTSYFAHLGGGDCTHYCHPGVPELWLFQLTKTLAKLSSCKR